MRPLGMAIALGLSTIAGAREPLPADTGRVELHAHLAMDQGMGWFFTGNLASPRVTVQPSRRLSVQANAEALNRSGLSVVVATLYAHPWLGWAPALDGLSGVASSLERQWQELQTFLRDQPQWTLARSPSQAREALMMGKRVLLLGLEGAWGALDQKSGGFDLWVKERGLSVVSLTHLTGDPLGGAAFLPGAMVVSHPVAWLQARQNPPRPGSETPLLTNPEGLTAEGLALAQRLIQAGVWLDFAHLPDEGWRAVLGILDLAAAPPFLVTHTVSRARIGAERGISEQQLRWVKASQGVLGMMGSEEFLLRFHKPFRCGDGFEALAQQWSEFARWIPATHIALGSDINGGVPHLAAECSGEAAFANVGDESRVWSRLQARGLKIPTGAEQVEAFLEAWTRAQSYSLPKPKARPNSLRRRHSRARAR